MKNKLGKSVLRAINTQALVVENVDTGKKLVLLRNILCESESLAEIIETESGIKQLLDALEYSSTFMKHILEATVENPDTKEFLDEDKAKLTEFQSMLAKYKDDRE